MPSVMIRRNDEGKLTLYVAKKDLEDVIISMEKSGDEGWGGTVVLADGSRYYFDPFDTEPKLPITVRARRAGGEL
ncbi:MAG TPA: putative nitrogen fixation protein NifT [Gammaproteobacteria bacterium]|nr:putative nitrogen fixation protein NifT [Gammaproteobacteria bacterium]HBA35506.1 putative nitrogen fixation protein NifT [Gammaproteobacteria bacterium]